MVRLGRFFLAVVGVALAIGATASAADSVVAAAETRLAGATSKQWILKKIVVFMDVAAGQKCSQGTIYTFSAKHQLDIIDCVDGALRHTKGAWAITASGPLDLELTVPKHVYTLSFSDNPRLAQIRLRDRDAGVAKLTQDRLLTLSDD